MGNRETQKTLGTRHRTRTNETTKQQTQHRKHWAQDTERGQTKQQTQHLKTMCLHLST